MTIATWLLFGLINGLIITTLEPDPSKGGYVGAAILGMLGATTGGMLAVVVLTGGISETVQHLLPLLLLTEAFVLALLFVNKAAKRFV